MAIETKGKVKCLKTFPRLASFMKEGDILTFKSKTRDEPQTLWNGIYKIDKKTKKVILDENGEKVYLNAPVIAGVGTYLDYIIEVENGDSWDGATIHNLIGNVPLVEIFEKIDW
jgi:hypothetical protein